MMKNNVGGFMDINPIGKQVKIKPMNFGKVKNKKVIDNWIPVDFSYLAKQLGVEVFRGEEWKIFDQNNRKLPHLF